MRRHLALVTAALPLVAGSLVAGAAMAGDTGAAGVEPLPQVSMAPVPAPSGPDLVFTLRGGASVTPDYFGSDDYSVGPDAAFSMGYVNLGGREFGSADPNYSRDGFGLRGSFRYIGERDDGDNPELAGLNDVDAALELGLGVGYFSRGFDAYADLRYGVIGHESFVGELGADLKYRATDRLSLSIGPRVQIGSDGFNDTYFGVTPAESIASGGTFGAYDPDGGIYSAGIELGATYRLNDDWGIEGAVTWDRLTGDAADSPIVQQGDRDQYGVRIGVTRRIVLDF